MRCDDMLIPRILSPDLPGMQAGPRRGDIVAVTPIRVPLAQINAGEIGLRIQRTGITGRPIAGFPVVPVRPFPFVDIFGAIQIVQRPIQAVKPLVNQRLVDLLPGDRHRMAKIVILDIGVARPVE